MKQLILCLGLATGAITGLAADSTITVDAGRPVGDVSPTLYGLMTEEINHCYDGGLYAELIHNRAFLDDAATPVHWAVLAKPGAEATIALDSAKPFNEQLTTSLRLAVTRAGREQSAGVANTGFWGIPVQPNTRYRVSVIARAEAGFSGAVTASIVSEDGSMVYATKQFSGLSTEWNRFELVLKTGKVSPTTKAKFALTLHQPGTVWFSFVSLFPPTWHDRPNGLRKDLMQLLVDLKPKFLRFPGGNYLEGDTVESRFQWKKTLGPVEQRHGHPCPWGYRSSDGMGLMEFLQWCEDMNAQPVLAVYAGYSLRGIHVNPGPDLQPFVQEALEEIEYVMGDVKTPWGARRAKEGHPAPFKLNYVEIGNEDWFDKSKSYDARFAQFYDAIKARYPGLKIISTIANDQPENQRVQSRKPDLIDEHYYRSTDEFLRMSPDYARNYDRRGPAIFVGEWAAHEDGRIKPWDAAARQQPPTPSMKAALGDAVFMAAMERNSDLILMQCYAPLFVNVNPGARQWRPDLIGYDGLSAYGSPSYYALEIFSRNLGEEILSIDSQGSSLQSSATRERKTGVIFLKIVNPEANAQAVTIAINGVGPLARQASAITLAGDPEDTNSLSHPRNLIPVPSAVHNVSRRFGYALPPHSIVVLKLKAR